MEGIYHDQEVQFYNISVLFQVALSVWHFIDSESNCVTFKYKMDQMENSAPPPYRHMLYSKEKNLPFLQHLWHVPIAKSEPHQNPKT